MPNREKDQQAKGTQNRGFASMDPEKQRNIASKGGQASGGNFKNDPRRAAEAGRKGGENSHGGRNS
jgi:general stress protein YciG